jgi:hypothetical protein
LLEVTPFEFARSLLDGTLDRVLGHVARFGVVDRVTQLQVRRRVAAAFLRGHDDAAGQLAPQLAALRIDETFFVGNVRPVRMTSHGEFVRCQWSVVSRRKAHPRTRRHPPQFPRLPERILSPQLTTDN